MKKQQDTNQKIALNFVNAINTHDIDRIMALMTKDHAFFEAYGNSESREEMKLGWPGYFQWFPDYMIDISQVLSSGDTVALFGYASGTYHGEANHWCIPAVWRVVIEADRVKSWQVYADSKIPYEIMV